MCYTSYDMGTLFSQSNQKDSSPRFNKKQSIPASDPFRFTKETLIVHYDIGHFDFKNFLTIIKILPILYFIVVSYFSVMK